MKPLIDQAARKMFLESRTGLGSSHAGAILGLSTWGGPADVYDEVVALLDGTYEAPEDLDIDQERGIVLEPIAIKKYMEKTGRQGRRTPQKTHPDIPFIHDNADLQVFSTDNGRGPGVAEIKCPRWPIYRMFQDHGVRDDTYVQVQHHMACWGYSWGSIAVYHCDEGLIHFDVERDDEFINEVWMPALVDFWKIFVEPRKRPPQDLERIGDEYATPQIGGDLVVLESAEAREAAEVFVTYAAKEKEAIEIKKAAQKALVLLAGDGAGKFEVPGVVRGTAIAGRKSFIPGGSKLWQAELAEHNLDISDYQQEGAPYWRLTPKKG